MTPRCSDECLFHWDAVVRAARTPWAKKFAKEIADKAIKPWWRPSAKQLEIMRGMVADLFRQGDNPGDDLVLIERG